MHGRKDVYFGMTRTQLAGLIAFTGIVIGVAMGVTGKALLAIVLGLVVFGVFFQLSRLSFSQRPDTHLKIQKWMDDRDDANRRR